MFNYLLAARLKLLIRQKELIFWTLAFPIFLGLLFYLGLTNTYQADISNEYAIGIVSEDSMTANDFTTALTKETSANFVYDFQFVSRKEAEENLRQGKMISYFEIEGPQTIQLVTKAQGMIQRKLKLERDQYLQEKQSNESSANLTFTAKKETRGTINYRNFYFFTLIGMAIGYGMVWGVYLVNDLKQKGLQSRLKASRLSNTEAMITRIAAAFIILFTEVLLLIGFFRIIFQIEFTMSLTKLLLLCITAIGASLSLGALLGTVMRRFKTEAAIFLGISLSTWMGCLAGMFNSMGAKNWIDQNAEILGKINLVNVVSESLFYLNYSLTADIFYKNIVYLLGLTIVFSLSTYFCQKRVMI